MNTAVIVSGGSGLRFGRDGGKQLAPVMGLPVMAHTLKAFEGCGAVDAIVLVTNPAHVASCRSDVVDRIGAQKVVAIVAGGENRMMSVAAGLAACPARTELVAVHDGARAAVESVTIGRAFAELATRTDVSGVVVGHPAIDTIKEIDAGGRVVSTPDRARLWIAQTPQVFRMGILLDVYARAVHDGFQGTDDSSLVERIGGTVVVLEGPRWNLKVTVPSDLAVLESILASRTDRSGEDE